MHVIYLNYITFSYMYFCKNMSKNLLEDELKWTASVFLASFSFSSFSSSSSSSSSLCALSFLAVSRSSLHFFFWKYQKPNYNHDCALILMLQILPPLQYTVICSHRWFLLSNALWLNIWLHTFLVLRYGERFGDLVICCTPIKLL